MGVQVIDNLVEKIKLKIPLSLAEFAGAIKLKRKQNKETREAHTRKEFPIHYTSEHVPDQVAQQKFLTYALSFIKREQPLYHNILMTRMQGMSNKQIAQYLQKSGYSVTEAQVSKKEAEAIRCVKETIERVRAKGIPIFEGAVASRGSGLILPGAA